MNISAKQWIAIVIAILGVLMVSQAQLTDLLGPVAAKYVQSLAGLMNMIFGSVLAILTGNVSPTVQTMQLQQTPGGQDALVRSVMSMKGIEPLQVNRKASPELAALAMDPTADQIAPKPSDAAAVTATAATQPAP